MNQSNIKSNKELSKKNRFTMLRTKPIIKNTLKYVCQLLKSLLVLYPIKLKTPKIKAEAINKVMIEFNSKTAKITDSVIPFNAAYTKYRIPTTIGGNFLNKKLNNKTATNSMISNPVKESSSKIVKNSPEEYVYQAINAEPNKPKNIQKNVFPKSLFSVGIF